jgi:shikimate kinase
MLTPRDGIVLIGMAGVGKSTVGYALSKALKFDFTDLDKYIRIKDGLTVQEILNSHGEEYLLRLEDRRMRELDLHHRVVAPGGSVIYLPDLMEYLKKRAIIVHLECDFPTIAGRLTDVESRGIIGYKHKSLREIYDERKPLYVRHSDITWDTQDKAANVIASEIACWCQGLQPQH